MPSPPLPAWRLTVADRYLTRGKADAPSPTLRTCATPLRHILPPPAQGVNGGKPLRQLYLPASAFCRCWASWTMGARSKPRDAPEVYLVRAERIASSLPGGTSVLVHQLRRSL